MTDSLEPELSGVCRTCAEMVWTSLPFVCRVCGVRVHPSQEICPDCRTTFHYFDKARAAGSYDGPLKSAIIRMKYYGQRWLSSPLACLMTRPVQTLGPVDALVPIPLSQTSLALRGFNQAYDLARSLGKRLRIPVLDILERSPGSQRQASLARLNRLENLRGTMRVKSQWEINRATILLVDDVMTTGSTADEAARTLKESGARTVMCVTLARTPRWGNGG